MDTFLLILRILGIIGIVLFCFSVSDSLEKIAKSLRRLADAENDPAKPPRENRTPGASPENV
jgi:hypothetical protein